MKGSTRKIDLHLIFILSVGFCVLVFKFTIVFPVASIGNTDQAAYAEMAESLFQGKGFSEDFIQYSHFFSPLKYPDIIHPGADYAPLYSVLTVPWLVFGKTAAVMKIPALLIGSILLPMILYFVTARISGNGFTALAAAVGSIAFPQFFAESLLCDDDLLFAFLVLTTCFFIMKATDTRKQFLLAGVFIALTFYAKGAGIILIPVYILFFILRRGLKALMDRNVQACFLLAILLMIPWLIRNTIHFGHPLYGNHTLASGYIGYISWEKGTYRLYDNEKRPTLISKLHNAGLQKVLKNTKEFYKEYFVWSFRGFSSRYRGYRRNDSYAFFIGAPALLGSFLFAVSYFYHCLNLPFSKRRGEGGSADEVSRDVHSLKHWYKPDVILLLLVNFFLMTFLAVCWEPQQRQALPIVLINMAIGWTTMLLLIQQMNRGFKGSRRFVSIAMTLILLIVISHFHYLTYLDMKSKVFPFGDRNGEIEWKEAGDWLKQNAPGAITMARKPAQLHFYSGQKTIQIPLANLDEVIRIMKYYKVTHLIPSVDVRPSLRPVVEGNTEWAHFVHNGDVPIYEIHWITR